MEKLQTKQNAPKVHIVKRKVLKPWAENTFICISTIAFICLGADIDNSATLTFMLGYYVSVLSVLFTSLFVLAKWGRN